MIGLRLACVFLTMRSNQVKSLMEEDEHKERKRTIGIISLWHDAQALKIDELLNQDPYISDRRKEHDIRCGDARAFQGDEKDVVLLSLVIGTERRQVSTDEAGFNVAMSRAKFSIRLFHSVERGDLKDPSDLRKKLLEYFHAHAESPTTVRPLGGEKYTDKPPVLPERLTVLKSDIINKLWEEGYKVTPILLNNGGCMVEVASGADGCDNSCMFVVLGASLKWERDQQLCYMLSRLGRSWQAFWLFDAMMRPDRCLRKIREFLRKADVKPREGNRRDVKSDVKERRPQQTGGMKQTQEAGSEADAKQRTSPRTGEEEAESDREAYGEEEGMSNGAGIAPCSRSPPPPQAPAASPKVTEASKERARGTETNGERGQVRGEGRRATGGKDTPRSWPAQLDRRAERGRKQRPWR